jgi:abortive infection bacteriophage resistance protein
MDKTQYSKPFLTFDQQLDRIEGRGLNVRDRAIAIENLRRLGYYRLSGYWYPFRQRREGHLEGTDVPEEQFIAGIWFEDIVAICEFDRRLRNIILAATEPFELAIRVAVAQQIGVIDPFRYLNRDYWGDAANHVSYPASGKTDFELFTEHQQTLINRSTEAFAKHFGTKYEGPMPIWTAIELWDFGMLTRFFQVMHETDREAVAVAFGLAGGRRFQGWLRAINDLRNVCAHHSRLFKRHFPTNPSFPKDIPALSHLNWLDDKSKHRLYPLLCVLAFTLDQLPECGPWKHEVLTHFGKLDANPIASPDDFGIPSYWTTQYLWSRPEPAGTSDLDSI